MLIEGDLAEPSFCDDLVEATVRTFGKLDILVSNAAHQNRKKSLDEVTDAEFDRTFKTNVYAYFRLARAALRHMKSGSAIIATSSVTGVLGSKGLPDYSATKGAINAFTKTLAMELVERGIRVNAVAPGPVWTPLNAADAGTPPAQVAQHGADVPMKRPATGGNRPRLRVPRLERGFVLHHRHGAPAIRRRDGRRMIAAVDGG